MMDKSDIDEEDNENDSKNENYISTSNNVESLQTVTTMGRSKTNISDYDEQTQEILNEEICDSID
jgi:hypothetical protein